jgi:hypothetical protein
VSLERGPLSLVSTTEELLGRKSSGSGLENADYGRRGSTALTTRHPFYPQKLALTSPTSGGRSVDIVRLRTQATELVFFIQPTHPHPISLTSISMLSSHLHLCPPSGLFPSGKC